MTSQAIKSIMSAGSAVPSKQGQASEFHGNPGTGQIEQTLDHVAIIMDGNGRWAKARGLSRKEGHEAGVVAARKAIETAQEIGLKYLTLYSFSTENWRRPKSEVQDLMGLMRRYIESDLPRLISNNVRVRIIGDKSSLPLDIKILVDKAEKLTRKNDGHFLQIAFNYGGRDELIRAFTKLAQKISSGDLTAEDVSEDQISQALDTSEIPDPDLIIRTSGEHRVSNFLLWQAAYAEYVFLEEFWPDFTKEVFVGAIEEFKARDRRYGAREVE